MTGPIPGAVKWTAKLALAFLLAHPLPAVAAEPSAAGGEALREARAEVLAEFAASSGMVFRGRCLEARPTERRVAGGRIAATTYSFEVLEWLKGPGSGDAWQFTQAGRPGGGPADLGSLVGLPVYEPGSEYVLFVLPPSAADLTSPAGAGEAAFLVIGDELAAVGRRHGPMRMPRAGPGEQPAAVLTIESIRQALGAGRR